MICDSKVKMKAAIIVFIMFKEALLLDGLFAGGLWVGGGFSWEGIDEKLIWHLLKLSLKLLTLP
jgi:hypothetical protein